MSAAEWEAFVPAPEPLEWFVERIPAARLSRRLYEVKAMQREGWDVTVLVPLRGQADAVALGCKGGPPRFLLGAPS